mmetsp:Transcript_83908/g.237324  ORF Transcript_83908/g.237324 Transcript_83908/m.237324 type:complete len:112 (-) Transcript_83908:689-1024(-)
MPITLDDIDAILGFGLPAPDFAADPPAGPGSAPTGTPVGQLAADGAERTRARKRTDGADSKPAQRTKKRRMTTEVSARGGEFRFRWAGVLSVSPFRRATARGIALRSLVAH